MPHLIWSPQALRDVQRLYRFLAKKDTDAARRAAKAIRSGLKIVAKQSGLGRPADAMEAEYREWPIDFGDTGYIALYRCEGDLVTVVAVRHQREIGY